MKAEQFTRNVLDLDPVIRFVGIMEKSGHLYTSLRRDGTEEQLTGRNTEISMSQSVYIVDLRKMFNKDLGNLKSIVYIHEKVKLFSVPVKEHVLAVSTESSADTDDIADKIAKYVKSVDEELNLYPPSNLVNEEKKEMLRNLKDSGITEDLIAEQLDLDIDTVKMLIQEMK